MKKTGVRIPNEDIIKINTEVMTGKFESQSDFIRKAVRYLLQDVREFPEITLRRVEAQK